MSTNIVLSAYERCPEYRRFPKTINRAEGAIQSTNLTTMNTLERRKSDNKICTKSNFYLKCSKASFFSPPRRSRFVSSYCIGFYGFYFIERFTVLVYVCAKEFNLQGNCIIMNLYLRSPCTVGKQRAEEFSPLIFQQLFLKKGFVYWASKSMWCQSASIHGRTVIVIATFRQFCWAPSSISGFLRRTTSFLSPKPRTRLASLKMFWKESSVSLFFGDRLSKLLPLALSCLERQSA